MTPRQRAQRRRNWRKRHHGHGLRRSQLTLEELAARFVGRYWNRTHCRCHASMLKRHWMTNSKVWRRDVWQMRDAHGRPIASL